MPLHIDPTDVTVVSAVEPPPTWGRAIGDALRGREHDYTTGSLHRAVTLLAPCLIFGVLH